MDTQVAIKAGMQNRSRPIARNFRRGVTCMSDLHKYARLGGSGGMLPKKILEIRCSEIASEAILGQKQSCCSYMACGVLASGFWHSVYAFAKLADFRFS